MAERPGTCWSCGAEVAASEYGRRQSCPCGTDTRCCRNCELYDPRYNNECREPQAERLVDKEKGNFCEFFLPRAGKVPPKGPPSADAARSALDALFKKKPSP